MTSVINVNKELRFIMESNRFTRQKKVLIKKNARACRLCDGDQDDGLFRPELRSV